MDDSSIAKSLDITSQVVIKPNEKQQYFETHGKDVTVMGFSGKHDHGSSKVKLKNIVDYKWEVKNYTGRLIAIHLDGHHIAYSIKLNNQGTAEGAVRVVNQQSGQRALIKGMGGEVLDLQFAYLETQTILACIDDASLFIHRIETLSDKLAVVLLVKIQDTLVGHDCKYDKVAWCPSVPQSKDDVDEYASQLLVWSRGTQFQCYSINAVLDTYGMGIHEAADISDGSLKFQENSKTITYAMFSPDGTTLGVSSDDGSIDFYQIYLHLKDTSPRRLHHWKPHGGKVVTSFFFLDNHTEFTSNNTFWKHAITGADNNTEFKVWRCDTWTCIQTVTFKAPNDFSLHLKAEIDKTSSYLMVSDTVNRGLYALQIAKMTRDDDSTSEENGEGSSKKDVPNVNTIAYVKSITEFPLSSPILSFGIVDAALRKYKCGVTDAYLIDEMDDYDEENNSLYCVVIHMFLVQPKSVQECHVLYQPTLSMDTQLGSTLDLLVAEDRSEDEVVRDEAAEEDTTVVISPKPSNSLNLSSGFGHKQPSQLNLMTPESFHSPGKKESVPEGVSEDVMSAIRMLAASTTSPEQKNLLSLVNDDEPRHSFLRDLPVPTAPQAEILASGGSSPSREVQKILSLNKNDCLSEYFDDAEVGDEDVEDNLGASEDKDGKSDWPKVPNIQHITQMPTEILTDTNAKARSIEMKLDRMMELMYAQKSKIDELESELEHLKKRQINGDGVDYKMLSENLEGNLTQMLEEYLQRVDRQHGVKVESLLAERSSEIREIHEALLHSFNQAFVNQITEKLSVVLLMELKHQLLPVLTTKAESMVVEIGQKSDHLLRDTISKVCTSKPIVDSFAASSLRGVQSVFQTTFTEILTKTLVPAFDKSTQEMFRQINNTFTLGITKFVQQLDAFIMQQQPIQDKSEETHKLLRGISIQLNMSNDKMINSCTAQIIHDLNKDFKSLQINLQKTIKECVKTEMQKSFEAQTANLEDSVLSVVRSQTQTPSIFDVQEKIRVLLSQGMINKAFHQALIANDLTLVEFVLDRADYKTVFNPCPLEQTVLLSLIQQITADMSSFNDVKHKYLSEAVMNLNIKDSITKEHAPSVMKELYQKCQSFIAANPQSHICGGLRMLLMAIQGLGFKVI
ncbi:enhancer of mRNA-decapping protein 4 homolog [Phlebotomus argentipes]|uniref:enhancer of mRNA-decapping protein 4 homolog n=1 Tax=Phlebotomus argentipes TaxID=94469 RepID=UPI002892DE60|nr:enhancer of mRNA-decapping protein 4 homolog [Phlebotomus argentipes]